MSNKPEIPNRVSMDRTSIHFWPYCQGMGVKFQGEAMPGNVVEFDVAEGWVRVNVKDERGRFKVERGRYVTLKKFGLVEPYWKEAKPYDG